MTMYGRMRKMYQIIRYWNGTKGYGRKFDTFEEAEHFLATDEKVQQDKCDVFYFDIEVIK